MGRGSRVLFRSALVVLVIVGITVAVLMSFDGFRRMREFRNKTAEVLTALSGGNVQLIHDAASEHFRKEQNFVRLNDIVSRMNQTLGPFKKVLRVTSNERAQSIEGKTAHVKYEFQYEAAALVQGSVSYVKESDKTWRLLGFDITIPPELEEKSESLRLDPKRLEAPKEVVEAVNAIIAAVKDGQSERVYEKASTRFKQGTTAKRFAATTAAHQLELGKLKGIADIVDTAQNEKA